MESLRRRPIRKCRKPCHRWDIPLTTDHWMRCRERRRDKKDGDRAGKETRDVDDLAVTMGR